MANLGERHETTPCGGDTNQTLGYNEHFTCDNNKSYAICGPRVHGWAHNGRQPYKP